MNQGRETADEVNANFFGGLVHGLGDGRKVGFGNGVAQLGDGSDRDALVDNGDAVLALELLGGGNQVLGGRGHAVVDFARDAVDAVGGA